MGRTEKCASAGELTPAESGCDCVLCADWWREDDRVRTTQRGLADYGGDGGGA